MRTVLVLNNEQVLGAVIVCLLQAEDDLVVSGFSPHSSSELIEKLRSSHTDVLILDNSAGVTAEVRQYLLHLQTATGLRVIVVDANYNLVKVDGLPFISINGLYELVDIVRTSR